MHSGGRDQLSIKPKLFGIFSKTGGARTTLAEGGLERNAWQPGTAWFSLLAGVSRSSPLITLVGLKGKKILTFFRGFSRLLDLCHLEVSAGRRAAKRAFIQHLACG